MDDKKCVAISNFKEDEAAKEIFEVLMKGAKKLKSADKYIALVSSFKYKDKPEEFIFPASTNERIALAKKLNRIHENSKKDILNAIKGLHGEMLTVRFKDLIILYKDSDTVLSYRLVPLPKYPMWEITQDDINDYEEVEPFKLNIDKYGRIIR